MAKPPAAWLFWRLVLLLLALAGCSLLFAARQLHAREPAAPGRPQRSWLSRLLRGLSRRGGRRPRPRPRRWKPPQALLRGSTEPPLHICFCTDDTDLRALLVAIKTVVDSSSDPARLVFDVVVPAELADLFKSLLGMHLEGVKLRIISNLALQSKITAMVAMKAASPSMRQALASPFNFAPYYLHEFLKDSPEVKQVLYLETDVVVQGDLIPLFKSPLGRHSIAVVQDCLMHFEDIFNFDMLLKLGVGAFDPRACTPQRGVMLMDLRRWRKGQHLRLTEDWLKRARDAEDVLWYSGFAGPPWMLALNGSYAELDPSWHCFNLGVPTMTLEQGAVVRHMGFDHKALLYDLYIAVSRKTGSMKPFMVTCSTDAKVLHFSGELKPWLADAWLTKTPAPVCFVPPDLKFPNQTTDDQWTTLYDKPQRLVRCMELWFAHVTPDEDCALKDFEREWVEEEQNWRDLWRRERKKQQEETRRQDEFDRKKKEEADARDGKPKADEEPSGEGEEDEIGEEGDATEPDEGARPEEPSTA